MKILPGSQVFPALVAEFTMHPFLLSLCNIGGKPTPCHADMYRWAVKWVIHDSLCVLDGGNAISKKNTQTLRHPLPIRKQRKWADVNPLVNISTRASILENVHACRFSGFPVKLVEVDTWKIGLKTLYPAIVTPGSAFDNLA